MSGRAHRLSQSLAGGIHGMDDTGQGMPAFEARDKAPSATRSNTTPTRSAGRSSRLLLRPGAWQPGDSHGLPGTRISSTSKAAESL
jgi:hypothetical protein